MNNAVLIPLSDIAEINPPRKTLQFADTDEVSFLPMSDVTDSARWIGNQTRQLREVKSGYTYFEEGDILFAKITPCTENGKGCLAVGLKNGIGFGSTEFHVLRAKPNSDPRFIFQWTIAASVRSQAAAQMIGSAGQQRVPEDFLSRFQIPALSRSEQTAIADILATVDRAIAQSEALIAKQRRIKAGLLHDLLTRGIDAQGNLRDLRRTQIPLAEIAEINPSRTTLRLDGDDNVSFIPMSDVSESAKWTYRQVRPLSEVMRGYTYFQENDVLVAKITPCAENGKGCLARGLVNGVGFGSTEFHVLRARENADADFIYQLSTYKAFRDQAAAQMTGSAGQQRVPESFLANYPVAAFSKEEQARIAAVLQTADDHLIGEEDNLVKLQRLKTGLMQDLLSGRVSVAGLVETISARE